MQQVKVVNNLAIKVALVATETSETTKWANTNGNWWSTKSATIVHQPAGNQNSSFNIGIFNAMIVDNLGRVGITI